MDKVCRGGPRHCYKEGGAGSETGKENGGGNTRRGQYLEFKRKQAKQYQRQRSGSEVSGEI